MTWVKVCGLRTEADIEAAVDAGAEAIGLVNVVASPRFVDLDRAAGLADGVGIDVVLLTEEPDLSAMIAAIERAGASAVQPYGPAAAEIGAVAVGAGWRVLRPVRAGELRIEDVPATEIPLVDAHDPNALGGTGRMVAELDLPSTDRRFVLAGGLNPANVAEAIQRLRPWGVDASSGLESSRGVKDPKLIRAFVEEAKQT